MITCDSGYVHSGRISLQKKKVFIFYFVYFDIDNNELMLQLIGVKHKMNHFYVLVLNRN